MCFRFSLVLLDVYFNKKIIRDLINIKRFFDIFFKLLILHLDLKRKNRKNRKKFSSKKRNEKKKNKQSSDNFIDFQILT